MRALGSYRREALDFAGRKEVFSVGIGLLGAVVVALYLMWLSTDPAGRVLRNLQLADEADNQTFCSDMGLTSERRLTCQTRLRALLQQQMARRDAAFQTY